MNNQRNMPLNIPVTPSFNLDGRKAVVTGGSQGIGLACSAALAQAGSSVTIVARTKVRLKQSVERMRKEGLSVDGYSLDVTNTNDLRDFFLCHGPFDIAVISAGLARHQPALEVEDSSYDQVMNVNTRAAYFTAVEAARGMRGRGGSIIQISSQMGHVGGIERSVYCASKHAIEGMTKSMAIEWGKERIRINTICPTFIRTELTEQTLSDPKKKAWIMSNIKLGRLAEFTDIMGAVVFLASDASAMITGTHLLIDGGWTAE